MIIKKIRKCYGADWSVEFELDGITTDLVFATEYMADRFYALLKAFKHYKKAVGY